MAPHPETIAAFFALAAFDVPIILLATDPRSWRSTPAMPAGTTIVVPPAARDLVATHVPPGHRVLDLPAAPAIPRDSSAECPELRAPGVVFLTSGSTGGPKPVYRTLRAVLAQGHALNRTLPIRPRGILAVLPLAGSQGFVNSLMQTAILGVPIGLLPRTDHRAILAAFQSGQYDYVSMTPFFASLLVRCPLPSRSPAAPSIVRVAGGHVPAQVFDAFRERFGVCLQAQYGTTEHGTISLASNA
jgi:acyl-CoA synthetase (AMP-forming)/AMP-acid ligase II